MTATYDEITPLFAEFARAWNAHDDVAMTACWAEDGGAVDLWGRHAHGRAAVQHLLGSEHAGPMKESSYRILDINVRSLSDEAVVVECDAVIADVFAPNGRRYELPHRLSAVLRREVSGWRFVSVHPSFHTASPER